MICWIVIPVKAPSDAKRRLASVLNPKAREALTTAMLARALQASSAVRTPCELALVGNYHPGLPDGIELLPEPVGGLNAALVSARMVVAGRGASRIVTLAADLPLVEPAEVAALCDLPFGVVGIAPDRHGTGTNALSLPLPAALDFTYSYGPGSYSLHKAEVVRRGLSFQIIDRPGLARDIDEPADLTDARDLLPGLSVGAR